MAKKKELVRIEKTKGGRLVKHGIASSYNNHDCRCRPCTDAWAKYMLPRIQKSRSDKKAAEKAAKKGVRVNL